MACLSSEITQLLPYSLAQLGSHVSPDIPGRQEGGGRMAQILLMGVIKQHKCWVGAVLPLGSQEGLSLARLTSSTAKYLPTASFEHHPCQAFSLPLPWHLIDHLLPACVGVSVHCTLFTDAQQSIKNPGAHDCTARKCQTYNSYTEMPSILLSVKPS